MKLTSIYNFVPLNEFVFSPTWAELVSQDKPFSDGEDGIIEVTLHNVSPLFTRDGSADRNNPSPYSAHIMENGKRRYYLPATSIKGMLRSTMEIMSFGKMVEGRQYTNRYFSKRQLGGKLTSDGQEYVNLMKNVRPAWLQMENEELFLKPSKGSFERIDYSEINNLYPDFEKQKTGWAKNKYIAQKAHTWYPQYEKNGKVYRIVCTGNINSKKKDFLFPVETIGKSIQVEGNVKKAFLTVHEPSPNFEEIIKHLKAGKELAVFYIPEGRDNVKAIGLSSMIRYPYSQSITDLVKKQQVYDENKHDLAETIFGYIDSSDCLRGRVQISNAFAQKLIDDAELEDKKGVLGTPKASFYPFYLKQTNSPWKTYDTADGIAGRKLYRIHNGDTQTTVCNGSDNEKTISHFKPIPKDIPFKLKIIVHNLRKAELGALLSAITLHGTKGVYHNFGLAKGYGYGKLAIDDICLQGFLCEKEEYMKAFEELMSVFAYAKLTPKEYWANTPQTTKLMGILSEHEDTELHVMEINSPIYGKEYREAYKNENFNILKEPVITPNTFLTNEDKEHVKEEVANYMKMLDEQALKEAEEKKKREQQLILAKKEAWKQDHSQSYNEALGLLREKNYDDAIMIYQNLQDELEREGIDASDEVNILDKLRDEQQVYIRQRNEAEVANRRQKQLDNGFDAFIDEKYPENISNPNAGKYKVANFDLLNKKAQIWIKKAHESALTDEEQKAYANTFHRLFPDGCHPKKEDKALKDPNSKIWDNAKVWLGARFNELLGNLYPN